MRICTSVCMAALLAVASGAHAAQEVAIRMSADFASDGGLYATGSSKNLYQAELGYAHSVRSWRRVQLWVEGSWTIGERHDRLFGAYETGLLAQSFTVGARGTYAVRPWFVPQVRAGAGALIGTLHMTNLASGDVNQTAPAFTLYALAGAQFLLPRPWMKQPGAHGVTAGVVVEGGYTFASDLHYTLAPASAGDRVQMPSVATDLGGVSLSGGLVRVGALLRF